jgi:hypothetical protein
MSFKAVLELDGQKFNIMEMNISFNQRIDQTGKPVANPEGGMINLSIETSVSTSVFLNWMILPDAKKSGVIKFTKRDDEGSLKTIEFSDAFCVNYNEVFTSVGKTPMITHITITSKKIKSGESTMDKEWLMTK